LSESYFAPAIQRGLGDGINQHCGPPYVLSPYRVVSVEPKVGVPETPAPEQPTRVPDVPAPPRSLDPAPGTPKNVDAGTAAEVTSRLLCRADDRTGPGAGCRWANQTVQRQLLTGPRIPEDGNMLGEGLEMCSIRPLSGFYGTAAA
jgi:hypothetical protein